MWNMIKHYDKQGYLMSGATPGQDMWTEQEGKPEDKGGLVPGHAYSIIQAIDAKNAKLL